MRFFFLPLLLITAFQSLAGVRQVFFAIVLTSGSVLEPVERRLQGNSN
jgi:hypothetical protein